MRVQLTLGDMVIALCDILTSDNGKDSEAKTSLWPLVRKEGRKEGKAGRGTDCLKKETH